MFEIIQSNFVGVALAFFLMLFIMTNNNFEKRINNLFLLAVFCVFLLIIEEAWEAYLALSPTYEPLRVPLSALGYILRPIIPYCLVLVLKNYEKKTRRLLIIPLIFNVIVSASALFCKLAFWYTPDNQFVRGPLGITPFIVAGIYVVILLVLTIIECRNGGATEALIVSAIALLAFVATIMESLFHFQFIQNPSIATSITFYYLFLHSNRNNRDSLTGALTRRRFYFDAERHRAALSAVISLDLNNLKQLNDFHGHVEGDRALIAVTEIIKRNTKSKASYYRIGGDEFMILCYKMTENEVLAMIQNMRNGFEKTKYRCAIGYSMYSNQMDLDHACQLADKVMYENKRQMKANLFSQYEEQTAT